MNQTPIIATSIAGAILAVIAWILDVSIHLKIPDEVAIAIATVISALVIWIVTDEPTNKRGISK